ncbi:MAG: hypothetical protein IPI34_12310 [bacterium]|nr:hypothetical protein [bacterium]
MTCSRARDGSAMTSGAVAAIESSNATMLRERTVSRTCAVIMSLRCSPVR